MGKPFNLEAVLRGERVQYRDLYVCEFLQTRKREGKTVLEFALPGSDKEHITSTLDGRVLFVTDGGDTQLVMAPKKVKKTIYINIRKSEYSGLPVSATYNTEGEARYSASLDRASLRSAVPVEIEVEE